MKNPVLRVSLLVIALAVISVGFNQAHASKATSVEYTYKVHNKSRSTITALLASEDGKNY